MSDMQVEVAEPVVAPAAEGQQAEEQQGVPGSVPVVAQKPSNDPPAPAPVAERSEPVSLEDAVRVMLILVKAHRTAGDSDLGAAIADVEAALPPEVEVEPSPEASK